MSERVVIVGGGGFGRETLDVVEAAIAAGAPIEVLGVVDSGIRAVDLERLHTRGVPYLGTEDHWLPRAAGDEKFIVAIGAPNVRKNVVARFVEAGLAPQSVVHPAAVIGSSASIGAGVVICSGVQISTNVTVGDHSHLNPGSIIGHDARVGDFVSVNPGAIVSGNVNVVAEALLGAGSVVLQGLVVGERATVGAAACVTRDVAPDETVVGVPARVLRGAQS